MSTTHCGYLRAACERAAVLSQAGRHLTDRWRGTACKAYLEPLNLCPLPRLEGSNGDVSLRLVALDLDICLRRLALERNLLLRDQQGWVDADRRRCFGTLGGNSFRRLKEHARRLVTQRLGERLRPIGHVLGRQERTVGAAALQGDQLLLQRPTMER